MSEVESEGTGEEEIAPIQNTWTREDWILLAFLALVYIVDAIEIYLPGVVNQAISCDIHMTSLQEGWLGIIMYITMTISTVTAGKLSETVPKRELMLVSLYASIACNVFSVLVHNYTTLMVARALIGITVGININVIEVFFAARVSSKRVKIQAYSAAKCFWAAGAGWIAVLGYFLIERVGWRVFIIFTSIPMAIPAILMLHFYYTSESQDEERALLIKDGEEETVPEEEEIPIKDLASRTTKASLFRLINLVQGHGSILLLPSLLRYQNQQTGENQECGGAVHGTQYLIIAFISGGANVAGRILGGLLTERVQFRISQTIVATIVAASYGVLLAVKGALWMEVAMTIIKIGFSMMSLEIGMLMINISYFGRENMDMNSGIARAAGFTGTTIGTAMAAFLEPYTAILGTCVMSCVQVILALSIGNSIHEEA